MRRLAIPFILALSLVLAFASPALAQGPERPGQVVFGRDITIAENETALGDLIAFGGNVTVAPRARVTGAVVAFGGDVTVGGEVGDSVVSFGGSVSLLPGSVVRQDVAALGGRVNRAETARVDGYVSGGGNIFPWGGDRQAPRIAPLTWRMPFDSVLLGLLNGLVTLIVLTGLAVVLVALFPRPIAGVQATMAGQPGNSAGIGCLALIVAGGLTLPLIVTCIGPFLLWAAILATMVYGLAGLGLWVGTRLSGAAIDAPRNPLAATAAGTALVVILLSLLNAVPLINCVGFVFNLLVASLVLGAVILSKFGTQLPGTGDTGAVSVTRSAAVTGESNAMSAMPPTVAEALGEPREPPAPPAPGSSAE